MESYGNNTEIFPITGNKKILLLTDCKKWEWKKSIALGVTIRETLETLSYYIFFDKTLVLSFICDKCGSMN